jgi:hypothetical protein
MHPFAEPFSWNRMQFHGRTPVACLIACVIFASSAGGAEDSGSVRTSPGLAAADAANAAESLVATDQTAAASARIRKLIRKLGDAHYSARRSAANELRQIGAEAFDLLHEATDDSDPEVAASARYLLERISVRWVQSDDSPAVRNLLRDYDRQPENVRLRRVDDLAELANDMGVAGLCRIARFDRSPIVSRMAALAIIHPDDDDAGTPHVDATIVERELVGSTRLAADWLRRFLAQLRDPASSVEFWQELIDDEVARLEQNADDTSPQIVTGLLWNLAELHRQLGNRPAIFNAADRMMTVNAAATDETAIELLRWMSEHKTSEVLDQFLAKYQQQLEQSKRTLYYAALARSKQGKADVAEQLAEKASQIDAQNSLESFITARDLEEQGQFEWASREYRRSIDDDKIATQEGIFARVYLAAMLHDYERFEEAANVIEPLAKAVKNDGHTGQLYAELHRLYRGRLNLPEAEAVSARLHFYRAGQYHAAKDYKRERESLELAIKFDPTDADVLIAMYRLPEADDAWKTNVQQRITSLAQKFQQEIDENPSDPNAYNQWAWLVSNTEGDFQKAVRYSHRSIELIPPNAGKSAGGSFLDTLGRCYFAAGDIDNALKYQRQALEKVDYMQVMHRQLAQFEKAKLEKQGARSEERETSDAGKSN